MTDADGYADLATVRRLIRAYQSAVASEVGRLRVWLGCDDLLAGVRQQLFNREGTIDAAAAEYSFHGIGCLVIRDGVWVDFDFGPGGRFDGFDAWRLHLFADSAGAALAEVLALPVIQGGVAALLDRTSRP